MASLRVGCVEWAAAKRSARGHAKSGDDLCVRSFPRQVLVAVLDGLGHGPAAAAVSEVGVTLLKAAETMDLLSLVRECHQRLLGTRGVVMSLAMFDERYDTMAWIGIGNVRAALWSPRSSCLETLLLRGGVVGSSLPPLQASAVSVEAGDTLVLTTDGVGGEVDTRLLEGRSLQAIADRILDRSGAGADDALVLVARYQGAAR